MSRGGAPGAHLRVAGGEAGGRRLGAPRGVRPTTSLVRQAIFNVLGDLVADAVVLDLFAGSGALGIEALSRGAASALFVDSDEAAVKVIRRNLESLGLADRARAVRSDAVRWLAGHATEVGEATVILLDPPYNDAVLEHALTGLDPLVKEGTTVVAEHAHRQALPPVARLQAVRQRRYGDSAVTVLVAW
jgi:16S rRNA (guanine966-N2)-methyltransferase